MVKFYLDKPQAKKSPIRARLSAFGYKIRFGLGFSINPALWDKKNQKAKPIMDYCQLINERLNNIRDKADNIVMTYKINREVPDEYELISKILDDAPARRNSKTFEELFNEFISHKARIVKAGSLKRFTSCYNLLIEFKPGIKVITSEILADFTTYLLEHKYSPNYINKMTGIIIGYSEWLGKPLKKKIKVRLMKSDKVYLSVEELTKIQDLHIKSDPLDRVRDLFIFSCWTGIRYSDLSKFKESNIQQINDIYCLIFVSQKTGIKSVVPLTNICLKILEKYNGSLPYVPSDQKYNEMIKTVCELSGINNIVHLSKLEGESRVPYSVPKYKVISSHTARRSFVTNMSKLGLTTKQISLMTGHTQERIVDIYDKTKSEDNAVLVLNFINSRL